MAIGATELTTSLIPARLLLVRACTELLLLLPSRRASVVVAPLILIVASTGVVSRVSELSSIRSNWWSSNNRILGLQFDLVVEQPFMYFSKRGRRLSTLDLIYNLLVVFW